MSDLSVGTHWNDCWKERAHHGCAVARIAQLESDDVESAREIDAYRMAIDFYLARIAALEAQLAERERYTFQVRP
jgi:hypothetical protein